MSAPFPDHRCSRLLNLLSGYPHAAIDGLNSLPRLHTFTRAFTIQYTLLPSIHPHLYCQTTLTYFYTTLLSKPHSNTRISAYLPPFYYSVILLVSLNCLFLQSPHASLPLQFENSTRLNPLARYQQYNHTDALNTHSNQAFTPFNPAALNVQSLPHKLRLIPQNSHPTKLPTSQEQNKPQFRTSNGLHHTSSLTAPTLFYLRTQCTHLANPPPLAKQSCTLKNSLPQASKCPLAQDLHIHL